MNYNRIKINCKALFNNEDYLMKSTTCVAHFGGKRQTAEALGLSAQAVYQWRDVVPLASAFKAQVVSGGKLLVQISLYGKGNKHD
jgi:hypothetical protein